MTPPPAPGSPTGPPRVVVMAAVARNGVIGKDGAMPWRLPADLRRFKSTTMGAVLLMGRRTYESIGGPLPGRATVVLTARRPYPPDGPPPGDLAVAGSFPEALDVARVLAAERNGAVYVQGGAAVYAAALPVADELLITWVDAAPDGDTFFPAVDWARWRQRSRETFSGGAWASYVRDMPRNCV